MLILLSQRFCKEVVTWKTLHHPNVLPLLGVTLDKPNFLFAMVSEWMTNGNINEFIKVHQDADRYELVRFHFSHPGNLFNVALLAQRRHQGIDIHAHSINDTRGFEGCTALVFGTTPSD